MLVLGAFPHLAEAPVIAVLLAAFASRPVAWMWPSAKGQIQTPVQAGGIAKALIRFSTSDSESFDPSGRVYVNAFPAFLRRMPGRASETYLRPADSAASLGSIITCALSAESTNKTEVLHLPSQTNLLQTWFHKEGACDTRRHFCAVSVLLRRQTAERELTIEPAPNQSGTNVTHSAQICSKSRSGADNASSQS
jgi:hypothetical protein